MSFTGGRIASAPVSLYFRDFGTSVRYITSMSILYQLFELSHKKCTEGHLPCTNGIVLIQKAGMKRCSLPTTPFLPGFYPNFYSGSIISVTNTPGSFCLLMYPPYFSTTRLIRFNPCP